MKNLIKFFNKPQSLAGYTLVELLIAASLTLVVVGAAGFGLIAMMQTQQSTKAQVERRTEVNRALDFISDEVRYARTIGTDASGVSGFNPTDKTVVLVLDIPDPANPTTPKNAVYYVKSNTGTNWFGPQVLYRWGPPLNADGSYGTGSNTSQALIDRVDDATITPNCPSGWSASPSTNAQGFYACMAPGGKMAQLYIDAQFNTDDKYRGSTKVFARASDNLGTFAANPSSDSLPSSNPSGCTVTGGLLNCVPARSRRGMTFQVISSNYACNAGTNWDVTTQLTKLDSTGNPIASTPSDPNPVVLNAQSAPVTLSIDADAGETIKVTSIPQNPGGAICYNSANIIESTNTAQVRALRNGDAVPTVPGFQNQQSVAQSLGNYVRDGKINIGANQIIYLFEIGQTDPNARGFDLQDNIVLVTISDS